MNDTAPHVTDAQGRKYRFKTNEDGSVLVRKPIDGEAYMSPEGVMIASPGIYFGRYPILEPIISPAFPWTGPSGVVFSLTEDGDIAMDEGKVRIIHDMDLPGLVERLQQWLADKERGN